MVKKLLFIPFLCFYLLFITSVYAYSLEDLASSISKFFKGFTGYQVLENGTTTTLPSCPYECCLKDEGYQQKVCEYPKNCEKNKCIEAPTTIVQIPCTDSDGGKNYEVKGTAKDTWGEYTDYCSNERQITEYYCQDSGDGRGPVIWTIGAVDCPYGCKDGACLPMPTPVCGDKICQGDSEKANCPQDCYVKCNQGSDCGQITSYKTCDYAGMPASAKLPGVSYACTVQKRYNCENPGTFDSKCVDVVGASCLPCQSGCQNGECVSQTTQTTSQVEEAKEQVKCTFLNSNTEQRCYTSDKKYVCAGIGNCMNTVYGAMGTKLEWVSSCGAGYAYTVIDGKEEEIIFKCESTTATQPITQQPYMKEQVTCLFSYSDSMQKCYTDDGKFGCAGVGSCIAVVSGNYGTKLVWKSSCGGYDSTIIDENNGYVNFDCKQTATPTPTTPSVNEQVKCMFVNSNSTQKCYSENFGCSGTGTCIADVSGEKGKMLTWKSTCGGYAYTVIDGTNDYAEFNCLQTAQPIVTQTPTAISVDHIKEQVWCVFLDSKVLQNPHTTTEECYSDIGFGCKWDGNVAEEGGKRYAYCVVTIAGERGAKVTWKSSCGSYAYSVMDGEEEKVTFQCIPETNVTTEQVVGKGFKKASWQCYDGTELIPAGGMTVECQSYGYWKDLAIKTCADRCRTYEEQAVTKCGINSLSFSEECYIEYGKGEVAFIPLEQAEEVGKEKIAMPPDSKAGDLLLVLFYKDNCPYCSGMGEELDKVSSQLGINVMKINADEQPNVVMGYGIRGFPSFILLKYTSDGIKEYMISGKTDSSTLIEWINKIKSHTAVQTEKSKEEIPLICKDACPSEGKCYPFGYRKEGKFCSDTGSFEDQFKEDVACENNFECQSNVCISGNCVSASLMQKIIDWFKNLFKFG